MPPITTTTGADGTPLYLIAHAPADLPPVLPRDLLRAWEFSREGARECRHGPMRALRFRPDGGGTPLDLVIADRDAVCWARAMDAERPLSTSYGLSLCLRLLALVALLAENAWARPYARIRSGATELDPGLLRLAAETALDAAARFDQDAMRAALPPPLVTAPETRRALPDGPGAGRAAGEAA